MNKIKKYIKSKYISLLHRVNILKFTIFSKYKKEIGLNISEARDKKIIVSLTTYPKRFNVVHLTIETLLNQSLKPDKIILYLAKDELKEVEIPQNIIRLKKRGIIIKIVDENLKSYKKLIYALKEYSDDIIITVDDDVLYPRWFIEKLYSKYLQYKECIVAYRCSVMEKEKENILAPYLNWENAKNIKEPSFNLFFTGVGGVLYPPDSLSNEVFNQELFMQFCPTADDVWFKIMSLLNETKVIQVFNNFIEFPIIEGSQDEALWKINNGKNQNDIQLRKVFDYFDLYKTIKGKK